MKNRVSVFLLSAIVLISVCFTGTIHCFALEGPAAGQTETRTSDPSTATIARHMSARQGGYLPFDAIPDSAVLLPPPPAEGSAAMARDAEVSRENLKLKETPRWDLAYRDAQLIFPEAFYGFSCIMGVPITETATPTLYALLRKIALDAGFSTRGAKGKYNRLRPFMLNNEPICTPDVKDALMNNGSYPSGHTAVGWAWALVLAELSPELTDAIIARGREFGESRLVCNVHWQSDVDAGRFMASATVARLHAEAAFRADMDKAREELQTARAKGLKPACTCE